MINKILDSTIYFSFDSSGFKRHAKSFEELDARKIKGKNVLITGGTSGIGLSCALELSKLGAYSLDNPGIKINYTSVLDGVAKLLKESFRNEQKKIIDAVGKNLLFYIRELQDKKEGKKVKSGLTEEGRKEIENILKQLNDGFGYSKDGAIVCLKYLIKKRYDVSG